MLGGVKSFSPFSFNNIDRRIKVDSLGFCEGQNTTNTNNFNNNIITVFPNPTRSEITIKGYKNLLNTEVFNVMGQKLQTTDFETISLNNYPSGIYLLKIFSNSGIKDFKIIKQ